MKRLLDLLKNPSKRVWVLNCRYCPRKEMRIEGAIVDYSLKDKFPIKAIREIDKASKDTFSDAYKKEREEICSHPVYDSRKDAVWSFYFEVRKEDVMLFVTGSKVIGYYLVTGDKVKVFDDGDSIHHEWETEMVCFETPFSITKDFQNPFFKPLREEIRDMVIDALIKAKSFLTPEQNKIVSNVFEELKGLVSNEENIRNELNEGTLTFKEFTEIIKSIIKES